MLFYRPTVDINSSNNDDGDGDGDDDGDDDAMLMMMAEGMMIALVMINGNNDKVNCADDDTIVNKDLMMFDYFAAHVSCTVCLYQNKG